MRKVVCDAVYPARKGSIKREINGEDRERKRIEGRQAAASAL